MYFDDEYVDYDAMDVMDYDDDYSVSQRRRYGGGYCATYVHAYNPSFRRHICYQDQRRIRTTIRDYSGVYYLRRVRFVYDCRDCYRRGPRRPGRPPGRPDRYPYPDGPRPYNADFLD